MRKEYQDWSEKRYGNDEKMNERMRLQIKKDYREMLQSEAGMRVLGGIFYAGGLNKPVSMMNEAACGRHDLALQIANTVREVKPYGVADCETAYSDFVEAFKDDGKPDNDSNNEY